MSDIGILQFNCGKSNYKSTRPILDAVTPAKHLLLAIQEPGFNNYNRSTYCPKPYTLACADDPTTKVCFMIDRNLDLGCWKFTSYTRYVAALQLRLATEMITIINVYNPPS